MHNLFVAMVSQTSWEIVSTGSDLAIKYGMHHAHEHSLVNSPSCRIPSKGDKETIS